MPSNKRKNYHSRDSHVLLWVLCLLVYPQHPEKRVLKKDKLIKALLCIHVLAKQKATV